MEEAKLDAQNDLKEFFAEMKSAGYEPKPLRAAFRLKAMSADEVTKRDEHDALVDLYLAGLSGMNHAPRAQPRVAREASVSVSALPIASAAPDLAAEESVGTDTSLEPRSGHPAAASARSQESAGDNLSLGSMGVGTEFPEPSRGRTAKPATAAKEAAGTHPDDDEGIPTWLQRGHPDCVVREQGRG
jgi:uncharacterized protein (UPF0335 family)